MFLIHNRPEHTESLARAVVAACRGDGWSDPFVPRVLGTLFNDLAGLAIDFEALPPLAAAELAARLPSKQERLELIQLMAMVEVLTNPIPAAMEAAVARYAADLQVEDRSLLYVRDLARGQTARALADLYRHSWVGELNDRDPGFASLVERHGPEALALTVEEDEASTRRWKELEHCPAGSLGQGLAAFHTDRGFLLPGQIGAANASVAHHDWIHLLADYGTTPLGEIETFSFIATNSCGSAAAFLGLLATLALFESGVMHGSLVTSAFPHQGISTDGGLLRMEDAIRRGREATENLLFDVDFFSLANEPLDEVRERFAVAPKAAAARALDPLGATAAAAP